MTSYDTVVLYLFYRRLVEYEPGVAALVKRIAAQRQTAVDHAQHCLLRTLLPVAPMRCTTTSAVWEPLHLACMSELPAFVFWDLQKHLPATVGRAFGGYPVLLADGTSILVRSASGLLLGWVKIHFISP